LRFEVLGTLVGSLEVRRRLHIHNLGLYGALLEAGELIRPGTRLQGRLSIRDYSEEVRGEVRHCSAARPPDDENPRFLVGLAFAERMTDRMSERLLQPPLGDTLAVRVARDRRRGWRMECSGEAAGFELLTLSSVEIRDLSMAGTMFASETALEPGSKGQLRIGLGDRGFAAEVEIRRIEPHADADRRPGYRIAASFMSMDEESRQSLASFLTSAER